MHKTNGDYEHIIIVFKVNEIDLYNFLVDKKSFHALGVGLSNNDYQLKEILNSEIVYFSQGQKVLRFSLILTWNDGEESRTEKFQILWDTYKDFLLKQRSKKIKKIWQQSV